MLNLNYPVIFLIQNTALCDVVFCSCGLSSSIFVSQQNLVVDNACHSSTLVVKLVKALEDVEVCVC